MHKHRRQGDLLATLAGGIAVFSFSPFNIWPVMACSVGVLFTVLNEQPMRTVARRSWLFGAGLFGAGISWVYVSIHSFGGASAPMAAGLTLVFVSLLSAVFVVPAGMVYAHLAQRQRLWKKVLLFSGVWVLFEWLRSSFLTGLPWLYSGYTLLDTPFSGLAPVTGVYGLGLLVVMAGTVASALAVRPKEPGLYCVGLAVIVVAGCAAALREQRWTEPLPQPPITFSAVQGNISQALKWEPDHLNKTINTMQTLSAGHWHKDLLLWPENAIPTSVNWLPGLVADLSERAQRHKTALILGAPQSIDQTWYNSLAAWGRAQGRYFKQKLVPFGEFVPFESVLRGLISLFDLPMSSFTAGPTSQPGITFDGLPIATFICYEIVYPDFVAAMAMDSAFLLTVSNDTWFGTSIGPEQHFQMVRMRSLETGRYQLRATNNGITALIDDRGRVVSQAPRDQQAVLEGQMPLTVGSTPFMRYHSWPVLLLALLLILPSALGRRQDD